MLIIGLTGGIGSGKSTVADLFIHLGVPVIDTDVIARELVTPGQPALEEIIGVFGPEVLGSNGELDRQALRQRIFTSAEPREKLEAILHPRIRDEVQRRLQALSVPYCIVVIPLLLESGQQDLVQRILVVDAPVEIQLARASKRDKISKEITQSIIAAQVDRQTRLQAADDVIHNDGTMEELEQQVMNLHRYYCRLSHSGSG